MAAVEVGRAEDIPEGGRVVVQAGQTTVVVFNVGGEFVAVREGCPHHGGPLARGTLGGTLVPSEPHEFRFGRPGAILTCPWHHWEFDLRTRRCLTDERIALRTFHVEVDDGMVVVHLDTGARKER